MMDEYLHLLLRTPFMFVVILIFFRLTGKKDLGDVSVLDVGITLMIADLAVLTIENPESSIFKGLLPIILLIIIQFILSKVTLKSQKARAIMDGRPSLVIEHGKCNQKVMRDLGYTLDDLYLQLRSKDIADISKVSFALLEPTGHLSVFQHKDDFSLPLILDGNIQRQHLHLINKDEKWLKEELTKLGNEKIQDIFICSYTNEEFYIEMLDNKAAIE
ncbi:hypothetical protein FH5_03131 [Priestia endophytica]|jgi:uncharacterized membrane protein YcaP (DUF421 family)|nr:hypothetical protein FH5_03131 [Priestia endophytica]